MASPMYDMGLAPGGRMRQEIYDDPFDFADWETGDTSRCFVHIANSMVWNSITGQNPPHPSPTAKSYSEAGLPWFEYYNDTAPALGGSKKLAGMKSVVELGKAGDLRGEKLEVGPARKLGAGNAHCRYRSVRARFLQPVRRQFLNEAHVRLFRGAVNVGVEALVGVAIVRLRVLPFPLRDFVGVDPHASVFHP